MRRIRSIAVALGVAIVLAGTLAGATDAYAVAGPGPITGLSVSASPFTSGSPATYKVGFRTSATGTLVSGVDTITISGPSGTFPLVAGDYTVDAAKHAAVATTMTASSATSVTIVTPVAAAASTIVTVTVASATNPTLTTSVNATYSADVSTSADTTPVSAQFTIGAATQLGLSGGNNQSAYVGTTFATHLGASLKDSSIPPLPVDEGGVSVVFAAVANPISGASGTFANGTATTTVTTGSTGVATATPLTANAIPGSFTVTATAVGIPVATFTETNLAAGVPGAPTGVSASAGDASATVSWVAPVSNGGNPVTGFTVTSSPGGITATAGASATSVVVPGLSDGTTYTFTVTAANSLGNGVTSAPSNAVTPTVSAPPSSPSGQHGYWLVGGDGGIFTFGSAIFHGSTGSLKLSRPVVGITPTTSRQGYWLDAADGGIFAFGDAGFYGSIPGLGILPAGSAGRALAAPVVGMVPSADGGGYFMVGSDGGVFAFGDAVFAGSCPAIGGCSGPAVAVMPDHTGNGYWLVTATGNVYAFGDAPFLGAPGNIGSPVTSAVRTFDGNGYWILFANGTVRGYGDAANLGGPVGSAGGLNPSTAIFATATGGGYWVALADGSVYTYGDAPNDGGMNGMHLNKPIIAGTGW